MENPSLVVANAGGGCYTFKFNVDPGNYNMPTFCGTTDGGIVITKNIQFLHTVIVGNVFEENTQTMICSPPDIVLPSNPSPGASVAGGGTCTGTNTTDKVPGKNVQTAKITVVGKETVSGVETWHIQRNVVIKPGDNLNTQDGTVVEDYWFSTSNGLVMRWKQNINATSVVAKVINVTFQQQSDITLTSPNPS